MSEENMGGAMQSPPRNEPGRREGESIGVHHVLHSEWLGGTVTIDMGVPVAVPGGEQLSIPEGPELRGAMTPGRDDSWMRREESSGDRERFRHWVERIRSGLRERGDRRELNTVLMFGQVMPVFVVEEDVPESYVNLGAEKPIERGMADMEIHPVVEEVAALRTGKSGLWYGAGRPVSLRDVRAAKKCGCVKGQEIVEWATKRNGWKKWLRAMEAEGATGVEFGNTEGLRFLEASVQYNHMVVLWARLARRGFGVSERVREQAAGMYPLPGVNCALPFPGRQGRRRTLTSKEASLMERYKEADLVPIEGGIEVRMKGVVRVEYGSLTGEYEGVVLRCLSGQDDPECEWVDGPYMHPHVDGRNQCLGSMRRTWCDLMAEGRWMEAAVLAMDCFRQVNPEGWYRSLAHCMAPTCPNCEVACYGELVDLKEEDYADNEFTLGTCEECGKEGCTHCMGVSEACRCGKREKDGLLCPECRDSSRNSREEGEWKLCVYCGKPICGECRSVCSSCGKEEHSSCRSVSVKWRCEECGKDMCSACRTTCGNCRKEACLSHLLILEEAPVKGVCARCQDCGVNGWRKPTEADRGAVYSIGRCGGNYWYIWLGAEWVRVSCNYLRHPDLHTPKMWQSDRWVEVQERTYGDWREKESELYTRWVWSSMTGRWWLSRNYNRAAEEGARAYEMAGAIPRARRYQREVELEGDDRG